MRNLSPLFGMRFPFNNPTVLSGSLAISDTFSSFSQPFYHQITMVDHYAFASLDQHKDNINNDIDSNAGTTTTKTTLRNGAKRSIMEPFDMDKVLMSSFTTSPFTKKLRTSHDSSTLTSVVTCNGEVSISVQCIGPIVSTLVLWKSHGSFLVLAHGNSLFSSSLRIRSNTTNYDCTHR